MSRILGRALGSVVSPIVEYVDVDGVVQRVDVDDLVNRIDMNALLDRIDIDRLVDRVDLNRHLDRVDVNAILDRVDVDGFVERSNIGAIVARSSSGVFTVVIDALRTKLVKFDQEFQRIGRCACFSKKRMLPPSPGNRKSQDLPYPESDASLALEIQGRYSGALVRFIAWCCDQLIIGVIFTLALLLVEILVRFVANKPEFSVDDWYYIPVAYFLWDVTYTAGSLMVTGRTLGKTICGLFVVSPDGSQVGTLPALLRTLLTPLSATIIVGVLLGWFRRDGRQLHDLLACTGVIFRWDAKMARLRQRAMSENDRND